MSVYDPFGFLADFLIFMKVLLQSVWRSGIDWDQPLPMHLHERWRSWNEALKNVSNFRVPRCLDVEFWSAKSLELHTFVDSSEVAFSAVCYLRIISQESNIRVAFVLERRDVLQWNSCQSLGLSCKQPYLEFDCSTLWQNPRASVLLNQHSGVTPKQCSIG